MTTQIQNYLATLPQPLFDAPVGSQLDSFAKYQPKPTRKSCISVVGEEKKGKTHFSLTAPGPIVYFNFDAGLARVQPEGKFPNLDMRVGEIPPLTKEGHHDHVADGALKVWEWLKVQHVKALDSARTVIYDSFTEVWELVRLARFGKLQSVQWFHFGPVNREFHDFIREYAKHNANLILIHKVMAEKDDAGSKTGGYERKGFTHIGFDVDDYFSVDRDADGSFYVKVIESGHNAEITGKIFKEPSNTFTDIALAMFPSSTPLDWL